MANSTKEFKADPYVSTADKRKALSEQTRKDDIRNGIKSFGTELYMSTVLEDKASEEEAIVQTIQNLCFIKPGTYPNDPDLGMGIEDEQFEVVDAFYIGDLQSKLDLMIEKYVDTDYFVETRISLKKVDMITTQKCLIIEVFVGPSQVDLSKIDLLFTRTPATNKLKFNILR